MEALIVCFNGGAFSAVLDITLCVAGVTVLYITLYTAFVSRGILEAAQVTNEIHNCKLGGLPWIVGSQGCVVGKGLAST